MPEIDIDAMNDVEEVAGIYRARPPISLRFLVPVLYSMAPALRKRRLLNAAWFIR